VFVRDSPPAHAQASETAIDRRSSPTIVAAIVGSVVAQPALAAKTGSACVQRSDAA
jgi:hypothetical protein